MKLHSKPLRHALKNKGIDLFECARINKIYLQQTHRVLHLFPSSVILAGSAIRITRPYQFQKQCSFYEVV